LVKQLNALPTVGYLAVPIPEVVPVPVEVEVAVPAR
jgi:hypothetical protein